MASAHVSDKPALLLFKKKKFVYILGACMRGHTQKCTTREAGDKRGGRGKDKTEQRHSDICGRERDGGGEHGVCKMDTTGTFRTLPDRKLSGKKAGNLKEVGLGWIHGGRKDCGFGWGKTRGGGEQLF